MEQNLCRTLGQINFPHPLHNQLQRRLSCGKHCIRLQTRSLPGCRICAKKKLKGRMLCISGSHTYVPKKLGLQEANSCTIAAPRQKLSHQTARLRLEGIPALNLWDMVIDMLQPPTGRDPMRNSEPKKNEITHGGQKDNRQCSSKLSHLQPTGISFRF